MSVLFLKAAEKNHTDSSITQDIRDLLRSHRDNFAKASNELGFCSRHIAAWYRYRSFPPINQSICLSVCLMISVFFVTLAASSEKRKVTVWRTPVRLSRTPVGILTVVHQGAACNAASVHFGPTIRKNDVVVCDAQSTLTRCFLGGLMQAAARVGDAWSDSRRRHDVLRSSTLSVRGRQRASGRPPCLRWLDRCRQHGRLAAQWQTVICLSHQAVGRRYVDPVYRRPVTHTDQFYAVGYLDFSLLSYTPRHCPKICRHASRFTFKP